MIEKSAYMAKISAYRLKIRARQAVNLFNGISTSGAYHAWMGRSFEYLCLQHADLIARELGFAGIDFTAGPYFAPARDGNSGVQVDLLFDRADDVLTVCEMKYSHRPPGIEVIEEMEKKLDLLARVAGRKTLQRVLIVRGKVSQALTAAGYFYRIIDASEAFLK